VRVEWQMRNNVLVEKPKRKYYHGRPRRWWENNAKIYVPETGNENVDWIHVA